MASSNDGLGMGPEFWAPLPGQDRKHFPLGTCKARPAAEYFATATGLASEQVIRDAIAGLSSEREIEDVLVYTLGSRWFAFEYMRWRLGMKK
jgi:hypothetical protein